MPTSERIVVVGASLAGARSAEALRRRGFHGTITIVGDEPDFPPIDRPPLTKDALTSPIPPTASTDLTRIRVQPGLDLDVRLGRRAVRLDRPARVVELDNGDYLAYDRLVIATGATPRTLPRHVTKGMPCHVVRTGADALRLRHELQPGRSVAVVGAGVLGCEIAASCRTLGLPVSLIDPMPQPMSRSLGSHVGEMVVARMHRARGVDLQLGRSVVSMGGVAGSTDIHLDDGSVVNANVVVVAIGVVPEVSWLADSGLDLADGVRCDDFGFADGAERRIVAAGDVARWRHALYHTDLRIEHWTNAAYQGQVAGQNLFAAVQGAGSLQPFDAIPYFWSDQFDTKLQMIGVAAATAAVEAGDPAEGRCVITFSRDGMLTGALLMNWPSQLPRWRGHVTDALVQQQPAP